MFKSEFRVTSSAFLPKELHHKLQSRPNTGISVSSDSTSLLILKIFIPEEFQMSLLNQCLHHTHPANTHSSVDSPSQQIPSLGLGQVLLSPTATVSGKKGTVCN